MRWPWQRRRSSPEPPAPRGSGNRPSPAGWAFLPPLQRTVGPPVMVSNPQRFPSGLASRADPSLLGEDSHLIDASAPAGVIDVDGGGLPADPESRTASVDMPLHAGGERLRSRGIASPTVQRATVLPDGARGATDAPPPDAESREAQDAAAPPPSGDDVLAGRADEADAPPDDEPRDAEPDTPESPGGSPLEAAGGPVVARVAAPPTIAGVPARPDIDGQGPRSTTDWQAQPAAGGHGDRGSIVAAAAPADGADGAPPDRRDEEPFQPSPQLRFFSGSATIVDIPSAHAQRSATDTAPGPAVPFGPSVPRGPSVPPGPQHRLGLGRPLSSRPLAPAGPAGPANPVQRTVQPAPAADVIGEPARSAPATGAGPLGARPIIPPASLQRSTESRSTENAEPDSDAADRVAFGDERGSTPARGAAPIAARDLVAQRAEASRSDPPRPLTSAGPPDGLRPLRSAGSSTGFQPLPSPEPSEDGSQPLPSAESADMLQPPPPAGSPDILRPPTSADRPDGGTGPRAADPAGPSAGTPVWLPSTGGEPQPEHEPSDVTVVLRSTEPGEQAAAGAPWAGDVELGLPARATKDPEGEGAEAPSRSNPETTEILPDFGPDFGGGAENREAPAPAVQRHSAEPSHVPAPADPKSRSDEPPPAVPPLRSVPTLPSRRHLAERVPGDAAASSGSPGSGYPGGAVASAAATLQRSSALPRPADGSATMTAVAGVPAFRSSPQLSTTASRREATSVQRAPGAADEPSPTADPGGGFRQRFDVPAGAVPATLQLVHAPSRPLPSVAVAASPSSGVSTPQQNTGSDLVQRAAEEDAPASAEPAPSEPAGEPPAPEADGAPVQPPAAPAASAAPAAVGATATSEQIEALADRLLGPLTRRLKAEMLLDRERRGVRTDVR
jgi:hypothetical protein